MPRAFSKPRWVNCSRSLPTKTCPVLLASNRARNSLRTLKSNPASLNSSERAYFFLDSGANRVSSLSVGEVLEELEHGDERQSPRGERGLTSSREERGEIGIFVDGRKGIPEFGDGCAFGERGVGDALRVWRDVGNRFRFEHATVCSTRGISPTESIFLCVL